MVGVVLGCAFMLLGARLGTSKASFLSTAASMVHTRRHLGSRGMRPVPTNLEPVFQNCTDLVMVAGHSVFTGANFEDADETSAPWVLLGYQQEQLPAFLNHIRAGVEIAARNPRALLVFSGGETRAEGGPRSEAQTYWWLADAHGWFGRLAVRDRAVTEEHARDSFENLLFSLCRFREIVGRYPETVAVVSFKFKKQRFESLHRAALRWPRDRFHYVGIDVSEKPMPVAAYRGEARNSVAHFTTDPYGCKEGGVLLAKKAKRNPFHRSIPYSEGCPEMSSLLRYCGTTIYSGSLPWD